MTKLNNLKNKTIIITGASTGLGKEIALKTSRLGAKVILISKNEERLKKVSTSIKRTKGKSEIQVCDLRDLNQVKDTIKKILKENKKIDIVINNAGVWTDDTLEKKNPGLRKNALYTNVLGNIQFIEEILPVLKKQKSAHIFNVISTSGVADGDNSNWKSYGASKWALTGYTKALRDSLKDTGIKVSGFFPGGFDSMMYERAGRKDAHKQPWMMKAGDVAETVIFALTRPKDVLIQSMVITKFSS